MVLKEVPGFGMVTSILSVVVAGNVEGDIVDIVVGGIVDTAEEDTVVEDTVVEDTVVEDTVHTLRTLVAGCYKSVFLNLET